VVAASTREGELSSAARPSEEGEALGLGEDGAQLLPTASPQVQRTQRPQFDHRLMHTSLKSGQLCPSHAPVTDGSLADATLLENPSPAGGPPVHLPCAGVAR